MTWLLSFGLLVVGCGDDSSDPDAGPAVDGGGADGGDAGPGGGGATAAFDPPGDGALMWGDAPFPHDLYLGPDGTADIGSIDSPDADLWMNRMLPRLSTYTGFCRGCAVYFPITGSVDTASIPDVAALGSSGSAADPIVMVAMDGDDAFLPLQSEFAVPDAGLVTRPRYGIVLPPGRTYVAALTSQLRGADGAPLAASEAFVALRDQDSGGGPGVERARPIVGPALDRLEALGVPRDTIVSVAVFTTEDIRGFLTHLDGISAAAGPPTATVERVRSTAADLDAFFGTPAMNVPGRDVPAEGGVEGETAVAHDAIGFVVTGTLTAPRIVEREGTDIGFVRRGADGLPEAGPTPETVPFVLTVPADVDDIASLPVAFVHGGNPGSRLLGLYMGNTFARIGIATLATDYFQMGARNPDAMDVLHDLRVPVPEEGEAPIADYGPDGLSEFPGQEAVIRTFGALGAAEGTAVDPDYTLAAQLQWILEIIHMIRYLAEGDHASIAAADAGLAGLAFDPDHVYFQGQSYGSMAGLPAVAASGDRVAAASFNVPPASHVEIGCFSPRNRPLVDMAIVPFLGIRGRFDENTRHACLNPLFNLYRWHLERSVLDAAAHYLLVDPIATDPPDVMFQTAGWDEEIGRLTTESAVAAAGVPVVGDYEFTSVTAGAAPMSANFDAGGTTITAGAWDFAMSSHSLLTTRDYTRRWDPPFVTPIEELPEDMQPTEDNPVDAVHAQIANFFRTHLETGTAVIADPAGL